MKVVTAKEMAHLESQSYKLGCDEELFMQNAGKAVAVHVQEFVHKRNLKKKALILAGKGNNAGDAYAAGALLIDEGYQVVCFLADEEESPLCRKQKSLFVEKGGELHDVKSLSRFESWDGIIIDGIFGTGLNRAPLAPYSTMIAWANKVKAPIIAVDIPSGLSGDTGEIFSEAIIADMTIALGLPKIGFFLQNGWNAVGELIIADFGLPQSVIDAFQTPYRILEKEHCLTMLPPIKRNRHKYDAGLVTCVAGSPGMPGAANLTTLAAYRAGCGLVKLYHPKGMESELATSPYEVIKIAYESSEPIAASLEHADSLALGPGLGRSERVRSLLSDLCPKIQVPSVIDADALFFYAEKTFEAPESAILTPHLGEMNRILGTKSPFVTHEYLDQCRQFVYAKSVVLVLKGGPSFIFSPKGDVWINLTGDPGMATAGCGDVLTGLIAAFLAQKTKPLEAALLGVCIHGWSGEIASKMLSPYCMMASDIIDCLPKVFSFR